MAKFMVCFAGGRDGKQFFDSFADAVEFYTRKSYECNCATLCDLENEIILAQEADNGTGVALSLYQQ